MIGTAVPACGHCPRPVAEPGSTGIRGCYCERCIDRDARVHQLARMTKSALLAIVTEHAREHGARWAVGGPQLWSTDELIADVLRFEFPEVTR